jgi:hypothetical protein
MNNYTPNKVNIKIVGAWNTRIFRPEWLIRTLDLEKAPGYKKEIGLAVNFDERDFSFIFCGISLQPTRNVLTISIDDLSDLKTKLTFPVKVTNAILKNLCHTPLRGIGFNFAFEFKKDTACKIANKLLQKEKCNQFFLNQRRYCFLEEKYKINIFASIPIAGPDNILGKLEFNFDYPKGSDMVQFEEEILLKHLIYSEEVLNA